MQKCAALARDHFPCGQDEKKTWWVSAFWLGRLQKIVDVSKSSEVQGTVAHDCALNELNDAEL